MRREDVNDAQGVNVNIVIVGPSSSSSLVPSTAALGCWLSIDRWTWSPPQGPWLASLNALAGVRPKFMMLLCTHLYTTHIYDASSDRLWYGYSLFLVGAVFSRM